ncbi:MAG: hypothetical protein GY702_04660 [Desulfobulbaceae bacterium]|nr:hypothetical protein [Desulfobulbaceae bacterium]
MINNKSRLTWLLPLLVLVFLCSNVFATPPQSINYQAYLTDSAGLPVNETPAITFRIYDAVTGGSLLWSDVLAVPVINGIFSVQLGTPANPLPVASMNNPIWLGVEIGVDGEAVPRKLFSSTTNAFQAEDSNTLGGKTEAELQDRVSDFCEAGQSISAIAADGTVSCEPDDNTTYSGHNFAVSGQSCPIGQIVTGINSIGNVTCGVDANSGGDITSVTAGSGLSGGATSGDVVVNHSNTSNQLSVNNSNDWVIQDITLDMYGHLTGMTSTNLDSRYYTETESNSNYVNASGDSMTGSLSISGSSSVIKVSPTGGTAISSNVMRNTNTAVPTSGDITSSGDLYLSNDLEVGSDIYANKNIYMNGNNSTGDDGDQTIYFYNGNSRTGESIKWNDFEAYFDLSASTRIIGGHLRVDQSVYVTENVDVTGTVYMGYEKVEGAAVLLDNNVGNCTILGTTNCYYASAGASCPVGKVVMGGGCKTSSSGHALVSTDRPYTGNDGWFCSAYSSGGGSDYYLTPYALCARMGD